MKKLEKKPASAENEKIKKQYVKGKHECNVTFRLPRGAAGDASAVTVVGDFNGWDMAATPMKKLKDGSFSVTVKLPADKEYRFKYLIDGTRWENDWHADRYVPNAFSGEDSVVTV